MKNATNVQEENKPFRPFNLQFFGGGTDDDNIDDPADGDVDESGAGDDAGDDEEDGNQHRTGEKTFTQKQVTALMAREKKEGRRSVLKALGFKSEAEAKSALSVLQLISKVSGQSNQDAADAEDDDTADTALSEAQKRAEAAENKLACISAGVNKESIDDALAVAQLKVTDKKDLATVLAEMSKLPKYASFFDTSQEGEDGEEDGTGSTPGHSKKDSKKAGSYGKRLAEGSRSKTEQKSTYF